MGEEDFILNDIVCKGSKHSCEAFVRAGPRSQTHFNLPTVKAAIVTCGGLCPGLSTVLPVATLTSFFFICRRLK
jgi:hypothetical protein